MYLALAISIALNIIFVSVWIKGAANRRHYSVLAKQALNNFIKHSANRKESPKESKHTFLRLLIAAGQQSEEFTYPDSIEAVTLTVLDELDIAQTVSDISTLRNALLSGQSTESPEELKKKLVARIADLRGTTAQFDVDDVINLNTTRE